jgi:hypothetical protein
MRLIGAIGAIALVLFKTVVANAAMLDGVQGQVLVNKGNGFGLAANGMIVNPGDQVVVNPGGTAQVVYEGGCSVPVGVGQIVTVSASAPCLTTGANPPPPGFQMTPLMIGAVVAGGIGITAIIINKNKDDKDKPASP